jgi:hypothetical protein
MKTVRVYLRELEDWIELPNMTEAEANNVIENIENCITNGIALRLVGNNLTSIINTAHIIKVVIQ